MTETSSGHAFEAADASFELLVRREAGQLEPPFDLEGYRVTFVTFGESRN
jgi:hypothetical protein